MTYIDIKEKRLQYKISQTKLAEASGFSKAMISAWELNKSIPGENDLDILSLALNKIISDIESGNVDVRKKRITHSSKGKKNLPKVIKTAEEYAVLVNENDTNDSLPYKKQLSQLYDNAVRVKDNTAPKAIALFSGCGGMSLGFAAQGFDVVGHVEIEDSANKIYAENFKHSELLGTDICEITDEQMLEWKIKFGEIDVLIGGPPCQGFSLAGKRDPNDIRNKLYTYYVHLVSVIKPKFFVMENVKLLTSMKNEQGELFIDHILNDFSEAGYRVIKREINAMNYGVPQSRERVILVGVRKDIEKEFVFPEGKYVEEDNQYSLFSNAKKIKTFKDATADLVYLESGESSNDPLHWTITHPEHVITWLKDVPEGCSAHDNVNPELRPPSGFNTTYKRIEWDAPCSTISTNFSMISGCRNVHPTATRSLTIREATRAQSFPDEFVFVGKWGDIRKAIGNAVPPILAEEIAKSIKEQYYSNY